MKPNFLQELIDAFTFLPGIGEKTAQRFVYHMLEHNREAGKKLSALLQTTLETVGECEECRMFSESKLCSVCCDDTRDKTSVCVVENPSSLMAIEKSTSFSGVYFVLHGCLSPLDGIGPEHIRLDLLKGQVEKHAVKEIVLAIGATVEGNVTAHVIHEFMASPNIQITRLAQGVPSGGELEYIDATTLAQAFDTRQDYL